MIEYAIGPVLALLISLKFGQVKAKKQDEALELISKRLEATEVRVEAIDRETLKKMMVTD